MPATKQQIRQIIADNNLKSVADVYSLLRDSFKDILQELMEAELDSFLGYEKNQKGDVITSNKRNGHSLFQFSDDIQRIMYATNIIEGLNRQYRKVTKTKSVFPSDTALEKMLYLASGNVVKKWTQRYRNWDQVLNQMIVLYGDRLTQYL